MIEKPTIVNFKEQVRQLKTQACKDAKELFLNRPVLLATGLRPEIKQLSLDEIYNCALDCVRTEKRSIVLAYNILIPEDIIVNNSFGELLSLRTRNLLRINADLGNYSFSVTIHELYGTPNSRTFRVDYEDNIVAFDNTEIEEFVKSLMNLINHTGIKGFNSKTFSGDLLSTYTHYRGTKSGNVNIKNISDLAKDLNNTIENFLKHGNCNFISDGCSINDCDPLH